MDAIRYLSLGDEIESCPGRYLTSPKRDRVVRKSFLLLTFVSYIQLSTLYSGKQRSLNFLQNVLHYLTILDLIIQSRKKNC